MHRDVAVRKSALQRDENVVSRVATRMIIAMYSPIDPDLIRI
jgi:hypothetical protein